MDGAKIKPISVQIRREGNLSSSRAFEKITDVFVFLSILFLGADIIGFDLFGFNVRLVQFFLLIAGLLLIKRGIYRTDRNIWVISFVILSFVSSLFSISFLRSIAFSLSLLFNVFFVFYVFSSYIQSRGFPAFIRLLRISFLVQAFLLLTQFGLKMALNIELAFLPSYGEYLGIQRFCLWYYEPSYLVTYFIVWYALALYMLLLQKKKTYLVDVIFCLASFLIATSSTGFAGLAFVTVAIFLIYLFRGLNLKKLVFLGIAILALVILLNAFKNVFDVFVARLFSSDLNGASGGRIARWGETLDVFLARPIFGVGPGCYGLHVADDTTVVPSNITLELLATFGILGPLVFYGFTLSLSFHGLKIGIKRRKPALVGLIMGLIAFTLMLQVNQGYLRLYHWLVLGAIYGAVRYYEQLAYDKKKIRRFLLANPDLLM